MIHSMTRSQVDSDRDRGLYHLYNVAIRVQEHEPALLFFNDSATVPAVMDADKATGTWIQFEAIHPDSRPEMFEANTESPVLFILPMINPAHALHDALFSIVLDNINKLVESGYCFDHYFLANKQAVAEHYGRSNWCQYLHHQLNIVNPEAELFADMDKKGKTFFFQHLLMPMYMRHRFAADWSSLTPFQVLKYIDQSASVYPLDVLLEIRRRLFRNCFDSEPEHGHDEPSLLVYDRADAQCRRWSNAGDALSLIQEKFTNRFSTIKFLSQEYRKVAPHEQARLFHESSFIISPHGGALANFIFCRPGTLVIEFTDQAGPWGWFHFCARLGMKHVLHTTPSLAAHYPDRFEMPLSEIRELIETHF